VATLNTIAAVALVGTVVATPILVISPVKRVPLPGTTKGVAVPGPVVGASVPAIALVGGYIWMVRRKKQRKERESTE